MFFKDHTYFQVISLNFFHFAPTNPFECILKLKLDMKPCENTIFCRLCMKSYWIWRWIFEKGQWTSQFAFFCEKVHLLERVMQDEDDGDVSNPTLLHQEVSFIALANSHKKGASYMTHHFTVHYGITIVSLGNVGGKPRESFPLFTEAELSTLTNYFAKTTYLKGVKMEGYEMRLME